MRHGYRFLLPSIITALLFSLIATMAVAATRSPQRPLQLADIFRLEGSPQVGTPWAFSPDGQSLAFTWLRPQASSHNYLEYFKGHVNGDVWVQLSPRGPATNITHGLRDGSSWWQPQWSPDGKNLAMIAAHSGKVRLWVWNKAKRNLHQISSRPVSIQTWGEHFLWLDNRHILFSALPEGKEWMEQPTVSTAPGAWARAAAGKEATDSVLESGKAPDNATLARQERLLLVDIGTGAVKQIAAGHTEAWRPSPDGHVLAYAKQVRTYLPKADEALPLSCQPPFIAVYAIELFSLDRDAPIAGPLPSESVDIDSCLASTLQWSSTGQEIAFLGYPGARESAPDLYRYDLKHRRLQETELGDIDPAHGPTNAWTPRLQWTDSGAVLLYATRHRPHGSGKRFVWAAWDSARWDWWRVSRSGRMDVLTAGMKTAPTELWPFNARHAFVGLSGGDIWKIEPNDGQVQNLTENFDTPIAKVLSEDSEQTGIGLEATAPGNSYQKVVFATLNNLSSHLTGWEKYIYSLRNPEDKLNYYVIDLKDNSISAVKKPGADASIEAFSITSNTVIYSSVDRNGTFVWRSKLWGSHKPDELISANTFLSDVAEGKFRPIYYTSIDGQRLRAYMILPIGYQKGRIYPTIVWIYPAVMLGPTPNIGDRIFALSPLSKQIPPAHGYAVLIPSIPINSPGISEDFMLKVENGVMPAVQKAVDIGISDPKRLFLMGHSYGGFSTYGLITQTSRFKAAVALAGPTDWTSAWGTFMAPDRYTDDPQEHYTMASIAEQGLESPPWVNFDRYLRNSPIFYVDRVKTPLMIIHGDQDHVPIEQAEQFFKSLYRQGKRAEFVRYWGEGHILASPANVYDMWARVFAWCDDFGDITRDESGHLVFDGNHVKSRNGAPAWTPKQFLELEHKNEVKDVTLHTPTPSDSASSRQMQF